MTRGPSDRTIDRRSESLAWPVDWSALWVGALSALAVSLVIALIGVALGAHRTGTAARIVRWREFGLGTLIFSVFGAFLSLVVGGWVAARIAGFRRAEPAMLHGAIVWLLTMVMLLTLSSLGVSGHFGPWYGGLGGVRVSAMPLPDDPDAARAVRNAALGGVTALLLGLVGGVIGGWMASGEPMTLTHYRSRERQVV
jgi:hypothetical protein